MLDTKVYDEGLNLHWNNCKAAIIQGNDVHIARSIQHMEAIRRFMERKGFFALNFGTDTFKFVCMYSGHTSDYRP